MLKISTKHNIIKPKIEEILKGKKMPQHLYEVLDDKWQLIQQNIYECLQQKASFVKEKEDWYLLADPHEYLNIIQIVESNIDQKKVK